MSNYVDAVEVGSTIRKYGELRSSNFQNFRVKFIGDKLIWLLIAYQRRHKQKLTISFL